MKLKLFLVFIFSITVSLAADSVDVVFRYNYSGTATPYVAGTFNGWNNSIWPMTKVSGDLWTRNARIAVGTHLYKFYYAGVSSWPNDPLNHHVNSDAFQNSILYVKDPTIYHLLPNQRDPIVYTSFPTISSYLFPKAGTVLDTSTLRLQIDGIDYSEIGNYYNFITNQFTFTPSLPLLNGNHIVILTAGANADTVNFTTRGGFVQLLNQFPYTTLKSSWTLNGVVGDSTVSSTRIIRNTTDTFTVSVSNKAFAYDAPLIEGANSFVAVAESSGISKISSPIVMYRKVNHSPNAVISFSIPGGIVIIDASQSSDPDAGQTTSLVYSWSADSTNPQVISGVNGSSSKTINAARPTANGEYYFRLIVTDVNGNKDTTRNYFTINNGSLIIPTIASNPSWAQKARIYFLFPKAFTASGTISAAGQKLQYIKDLGFNVIWLMPVMKNAYPIDNGIGPGYNITDFYNVAPEYGTNQDMKNFISQAHIKGIKVILDITPNHSSRFHPWSADAHTFKTNSFYWNWYQHQDIPHNTNGLGTSYDADNFWYYDGWDQLLNLNWLDIDFRTEMINVYKYWIKEFDVDGYRFDVYWGPHRRYGERYMGQPVRQALKHIKPDILLLAEDDGTGSGTETIYADYSNIDVRGGVDASYDFKLYRNSIVNFGFSSTAITNLHAEIDNVGFYPGVNSLYMRFMETQDEDRIFYNDPYATSYYDNNPATAFKKTMPMASVIFTAPGFPMLWNGQEVGWGYGIAGDKIARNRSVINWDFQGKNLLIPHYQKLANIRGQFPAFTQHKRDTNHDFQVNSSDTTDFIRITSSNNIVYAFSRPYSDQNGLTVVNFSGNEQSASLDLTINYGLKFSDGIQPAANYYLNNLYTNTSEQILGSTFNSVSVTLPAYGTALYTVSLTRDTVVIDNPILDVLQDIEIPKEFALLQNYPNPFNPTTRISYSIPTKSVVKITIYDLLGREVETVVNGEKPAGSYDFIWNAGNVASGIYFYRMTTERFSTVHKMILIR
jgi:glycosidase